MKKIMLTSLMLSGLLVTSQYVYADSNVALGKVVTLSAHSFGGDQGVWGNHPLADPQSLTDGLFQVEQSQWNINSIFWNGTDRSIEINLAGIFDISRFTVQADDNDAYLIEYKLGAGPWQTAWSVPVPGGWGLTTSSTSLASAITADALRFSATSGDNYYSVSEIQAFGVPAVPVPAALPLMLSGLGLLGFANRKRS